jgi:flavin-binding protein dodecin
MSVARVTEIIASSAESFEDATRQGLKRASKTLKNVKGAWVEGQKVSGDLKGYVHPRRLGSLAHNNIQAWLPRP